MDDPAAHWISSSVHPDSVWLSENRKTKICTKQYHSQLLHPGFASINFLGDIVNAFAPARFLNPSNSRGLKPGL